MPPLPRLLKGRLAVLSMAVAETMGRKGGWSADCSHHRLWLEQSPHPGGSSIQRQRTEGGGVSAPRYLFIAPPTPALGPAAPPTSTDKVTEAVVPRAGSTECLGLHQTRMGITFSYGTWASDPTSQHQVPHLQHGRFEGFPS